MAQPIPFNLDAYGNYARASALADYLELAALAGTTFTRRGFADHLADAKATRRMNDMFVGDQAGEDGDEDEAGEGATGEGPGVAQANRVFDLLDERAEALGDLWPFQLNDDNTLAVREGVLAEESMYVALLALTAAHAYAIESEHDPKQVLEDTVARAMVAIGLASVNVGLVSRGAGDFRATIRAVGDRVDLRASPLAATTYKYANEEGVDCVGHLPGAVPRGGGSWVFVGQVTCGESESWERKLDEPKPALWRQLLNTGILPQAFLAVPHHVEPAHLAKLVMDADRLVLDRLRLTPLAGQPSDVETAIRTKVLEVGVEQLV